MRIYQSAALYMHYIFWAYPAFFPVLSILLFYVLHPATYSQCITLIFIIFIDYLAILSLNWTQKCLVILLFWPYPNLNIHTC